MKVGELTENFRNEFGGTLRLFDGNNPHHLSDQSQHLKDACIHGASPSGKIDCPETMTVGEFRDAMKQLFGLIVKVASKDDWVLVPDNFLLVELPRIPKQARKSDIEKLITVPSQNSNTKSGYLYYGSFDHDWFKKLQKALREVESLNEEGAEDELLYDFDNDIIHLIGSNQGERMEEMVDDGIYVDDEYPNGYIVFYKGKELYAIW